MKKMYAILSIVISVSLSGCNYGIYPDRDIYVLKNSIEHSTKTYDAIIIPIEKLYINTCSRTMLISIDAIGESKADRIIEARKIAPILSMEDVEKIKGLGTKAILEIEKRVVFDGISSKPKSSTDTNDS